VRLGLILPAETEYVGGVQRFGAELHTALQSLANVEAVRLHPPYGVRRTVRSRLRAITAGGARLVAAHRREPLDAVLSTYFYPTKVIPGRPMAGFVHDLRLWGLQSGAGFESNRYRPIPLALAAIFRTWDVIFVPSPHVAEDVQRLVPGRRIATVGEGLDHLAPLGSAERPARDTVVVFAGQMAHKRGNLGLAVAERLAQELGCPTVVLGSVNAPSAGSRVRVQKIVPERELVRLLERCRVAIAPTSYEGFGLAAGEAMWFGAPVVYAADCPMEHLIGDGGLSAQPDIDAFVAAALQVWNESEAYGARAFRRASGYTWANTAHRIVDVLRNVS
jgi:glycosyltransferase involved in cell wall biosynthesis